MTALISVVAGICTAPYLTHHFQVANPYAVLANVLAEPLSALLIMPGVVLSFLLMPFGLESIGFLILEPGISWLLKLAAFIAALPGAQIRMPAMPLWGLVALTLGGLWLLLWRGSWRRWGVAGIVIGMFSYAATDMPDVIASSEAVAVRSGGGLIFLDGEDSYQGEIWRRSWGEGSEDSAFRCDGDGCILRRAGRTISLPRSFTAVQEDCKADFMLARFPLPAECGRWGNLDGWNLAAEGVVMLTITSDSIHITSARESRGRRPWSTTSKSATTTAESPPPAIRLP